MSCRSAVWLPTSPTTLLNGREQVSASNNRGVELDQYPSELLNGAVVYKTPDASLIGQALGGTIDMRTVRPLAYGKRAIAVGARFEVNDLGKLNPDISNKGYRANISYIDQNADGTLGWAIGHARMQSPTAEERFNAWGYPEVTDGTNTAFLIGGAKPYVKSNELKRDGVMAVVEWQPERQVPHDDRRLLVEVQGRAAPARHRIPARMGQFYAPAGLHRRRRAGDEGRLDRLPRR